MNDDPASAPVAGSGESQPQLPPGDGEATAPPPVSPTTPAPSRNDDNSPEARYRRRIFIQTKKRTEFVHDIIVNLDMLIYAELCYMYYLDCSLFRFTVRAITQLLFLSPAPQTPPPFTGNRPYGPAILGTNALCIFLHIVTARPSAGELTRGYLHGGLFIDFIGQKAPSTKFLLILLDFVILALQLFMLPVHIEETRLKAALENRDSMTAFIANHNPVEIAYARLDHDAEERGVAPQAVQDAADGIEMRNLASSGVRQGDEEADALLAERIRRLEEEDAGVVDLFYSGTVVVGEFHVLETLRRQLDRREGMTGEALSLAGHTAGRQLTIAGRGISRRLGRMG